MQEAPKETQIEEKEENSLEEVAKQPLSPVVKIDCNLQDNVASTTVEQEMTPMTDSQTPYTDSKKVVARERVEFATPLASGAKRAIIFSKPSPQQDGAILDNENRSSAPTLTG